MTIRELIRINEQERAKLAAMLQQAQAEREREQAQKQQRK